MPLRLPCKHAAAATPQPALSCRLLLSVPGQGMPSCKALPCSAAPPALPLLQHPPQVPSVPAPQSQAYTQCRRLPIHRPGCTGAPGSPQLPPLLPQHTRPQLQAQAHPHPRQLAAPAPRCPHCSSLGSTHSTCRVGRSHSTLGHSGQPLARGKAGAAPHVPTKAAVLLPVLRMLALPTASPAGSLPLPCPPPPWHTLPWQTHLHVLLSATVRPRLSQSRLMPRSPTQVQSE